MAKRDPFLSAFVTVVLAAIAAAVSITRACTRYERDAESRTLDTRQPRSATLPQSAGGAEARTGSGLPGESASPELEGREREALQTADEPVVPR